MGEAKLKHSDDPKIVHLGEAVGVVPRLTCGGNQSFPARDTERDSTHEESEEPHGEGRGGTRV
jgi:hypothetical protein